MVKYSELFTDVDQNANKITRNVFDELDAKIATLKQKGIDVIDCGVGDPAKTLGIAQLLVEKFNVPYDKFKFLGYPGNGGDKEFITSAIDYLAKQHNIKISNNEIIISNGSKTPVSTIAKLFVDPQDIVICPTPAYPNFAMGARLFNATPYFVPLLKENNFLIDFKSISAEIANKAKCIWINYPNSPTGAIAPQDYLVELINWCHKYDIILLSDEAYIDIYFDKPQISPLNITTQGVLSFYSLSKSFNLTNARIGFVAGDEKLIKKAYKLSNMYNDGVPSLIQHFGAIALNHSDNLLPSLRSDYTTKANLLKNAFVDIFNAPFANHSLGSIFLWQQVPTGYDDESFCDLLLNAGVATLQGGAFSAEGKKFIRIALIQPQDKIINVIERLKTIKIK